MTRILCASRADLCTSRIISHWSRRRLRSVSYELGRKKAHILHSVNLFTKIVVIQDNVGKCGRVRQTKNDNVWCMRFVCWLTRVIGT